MRKLVELPAEARARALGDALEAEGVGYQIDPGDGDSWHVWVVNDSDVESARELLAAWEAAPDAPRWKAAAEQAERRRKRARAEAERSREVQARADRARRPIGLGVVTVGVIGVSVILTLLGITALEQLPDAIIDLPSTARLNWAFIDDVIRRPQLYPDVEWSAGAPPFLHQVLHGQVWRLITPVFVHTGGLFHLLFNAYWFLLFGRQIETRKGPIYLLALVLMFGIASNLAQYAVGWSMVAAGWSDPAIGLIYLGGPTGGGLSGVVYGLLGYIWIKSVRDKFSGLGVTSSTVGILVVWMLICFAGVERTVGQPPQAIITGIAGPVANLAHLGGLLAGVLWGAVSHRIRKSW